MRRVLGHGEKLAFKLSKLDGERLLRRLKRRDGLVVWL